MSKRFEQKEINVKRVHPVWCQVYIILETVKLERQQNDLWVPGIWGSEGWIGGAKRIFMAVKLLWDTNDSCGYTSSLYIYRKPIEQPTPRVNLNVNNGRWLIRMCQCWFIHCNKCTTDMGWWWWGGCVFWGKGAIWVISTLSSWFCCEPTTGVKNKVFVFFKC